MYFFANILERISDEVRNGTVYYWYNITTEQALKLVAACPPQTWMKLYHADGGNGWNVGIDVETC